MSAMFRVPMALADSKVGLAVMTHCHQLNVIIGRNRHFSGGKFSHVDLTVRLQSEHQKGGLGSW